MSDTQKHTKPNVPNLRFPGFEGEWEECCNGDFGKIVTGNTPPTAETRFYENGHRLWASPADLGGDKYISSTQTKLTEEGFSKTRIVPHGATLVTCIGSTIGKMGMASQEMSTNQQINTIIPNDLTDRQYLYYAVQSQFPRYVKSIAVQAVPIISKGSFEKLKNYRPHIDEQKKIGSFLDLLDRRISIQNKVIEDLKKLKTAICTSIAYSIDAEWRPLASLISSGSIVLKRGLVIPKKEKSQINRYPVYSSSVVNDGLMGYNDTYMFEDELVSWSIDGGGNFFYRHPHKFNITNVSGVILADKAIWNYRFIAEMLSLQHSKQIFDYQSKAHPSVICDLYSLPMISLDKQTRYAQIFEAIDERLSVQKLFQKNAKQMKTYLMRQMFI